MKKGVLKTDTGGTRREQGEAPASPRRVTVTLPTENWRAEPDRCKLCPRTCYTHNCIVFNAVFSCLGFLFAAGVFIGIMSTNVRPHLTVLGYVNGTCRTINYTWTGQRETCACGKRHCSATYPCLAVTVEYMGRNGKVITSMMHEEEHVFTYRPHCSFQPVHCTDGYNPFSVSQFFNKWAVPGRVYPCYHNPTGKGVLRKRTRSVAFIIHLIFWPLFFTILFFILYLVIYFYCCVREID